MARLWLRDLIPSQRTALASVPYVRELNPTNYESATAVAEGGTKPIATLSFDGAVAPVSVLASDVGAQPSDF